MFADTFELEIAFDEIGKSAGEQHGLAQLLGEGFETRSHVDRGTDDGEVEPSAGPDIAVHDVADMEADAEIQRRTSGAAVLFVQGGHSLTRLGHSMQQIGAGRGLAERKDGKQTIAHELQYFAAVSGNRLRDRVEIVVQEIDHVIARPVVRYPGEIAQIADHDGGAYRCAACRAYGTAATPHSRSGPSPASRHRPRACGRATDRVRDSRGPRQRRPG